MPLRAGEVATPSKIRDGAAFSEVTAPLGKQGWEYGHILFNSPFDHKKDKKLGHDHFNFIKPEDLIVLTTRPPLDDRRHGDKKHMDESYTHLEQQIFAEFAGRHFARAHILRALSAALIGLVAREMAANGRMPGGMAKPDLFRRFEALLEQHFLQHWTVSDYAAALAITPTHLSLSLIHI